MSEYLDENVFRQLRLELGEDGQKILIQRVFQIAYKQLRAIARKKLQKEGSHTFESRDLVHEAFCKIAQSEIPIADRRHFLNLVAKVMQRILIDYARVKSRKAHGQAVGEEAVVPEQLPDATEHWSDEQIELEQLLSRLEKHDPTWRLVATMRIVFDMKPKEIRDVLQIEERKLERIWAACKIYLKGHLAARIKEKQTATG